MSPNDHQLGHPAHHRAHGLGPHLRGLPLEAAPFTNGLIWIIDISIGLGCGKILTVLAVDAHHHQLESGAPTLHHVRCIGVAVAASWNGDTIADFLKRLIAVMGRPAAYLKDGGSDLHRAAALLEEQDIGSPCIDDVSHAAANMLKRIYQHHPAFERFLSACGQVSGKLKQTLLACLAPPTVRTKARFMNVHRLLTWAERVLELSPPGGAKSGCDQRSLVTFTPPLELAAALGAIAKTRPTSGWLERPAVPTWD